MTLPQASPYNHPVQPPASLQALGDPIYEAFYGLKEQPFAITTDPRFFYLSASHQLAFSELLNGLRRRESLLLLTGETGAGKTTLCRAVIDALGERTFSAMILNPYMSGAEVLRIVLRDFGLVSHEELRRGALASADVAQLLDTLEGFLQSLAPIGSHAVIVLDEAQALSPQTLDQVRLLTGLEHDGHRLVQIVLCGQAGLLTTLKAEALKALNERITRRVEIGPLPPDEVEGYIHHRLAVAGGLGAVSFDRGASKVVADLSRGVPRRINVLCDRALQEGRIEGVDIITSDLVKRAARAVAGVHDPRPVAPKAPPPPAPAPAPAAAAPAPAEVQPHVEAFAETSETAAVPLEEQTESVEAALLSFEGDGDEATTSRWRRLVLPAVGLAALVAAAYAGYAWSVTPTAAMIPGAPAGPAAEVQLPGPLAVPSAEEINSLIAPVRRPLDPSAAAEQVPVAAPATFPAPTTIPATTPPVVAAPPPPAAPVASPELPDDGNQFN